APQGIVSDAALRLAQRRRGLRIDRAIRDGDAIDLPRPFGRDETGRDIGCDHLRIALERLAKATPTAAPQPDDLAPFGAVDRALAHLVRLAVAPRPGIAACRAGQT